MIRKTFAWLLVAGLAGAAAWAQTADEIIDKHLQAMGGKEKLKAVQSQRISGKMVIGQGMEAPFTMEILRPNKMRMEFTIQGMTGVQAFDGTAGWSVMPFMGKTEPEAMPEDEANSLLLELFMHQTRPQFVYRHRWSQGMLVMWDNRCVLHAATGGYQGHKRLLHRITVAERRI